MKTLKEYLVSESTEDCKTFTFNFDAVDNAEETVKSLGEQDNVTVSGNIVTVSVCKDNVSSLDTVVDIIQQSYDVAVKSSSFNSSAPVQTRVKKIGTTLADMTDCIDCLENPESCKDDDNKE